ncbi:hypothetical protein K2173_005456 [Erythroxylum novogranatense]|uniref:BHLH domain-containing protein n=1 Tax=Erythroxylum novogranatense TaxID=1862640 RepID=A0AAV8SJY9_9ROSI|nr:hypothetical protein K2173_005456 [Erythroxylum novogranatense]
MSGFSYQHHPFVLDSVILQSTPIKNMSGFMENGNIKTNCFSQFYPFESLYETPVDVSFQEVSHVDQNSYVVPSDTETSSVTKKQSTGSSTVVNKLESGEQVTQVVIPMNKKRKHTNGSTLTSAQSKDAWEDKSKNHKKCNGEVNEAEKKPKAEKKDQKKVTEEPPTGYIHVRARRGQATDSHSLAERVRREKISERMKTLQRIVPGCDKVTGKAQMLDEIINYVQSLQNQVEFLSMKLASVNPLFYDFGVDLDHFIVMPEKLNNLPSPLPSVQQCSPTQSAAFGDTTTIAATSVATTNFATVDSYTFIDRSASLLVQGEGSSELVTKDSGSLLWEVDEKRQKLQNPSGFTHDLCSFH